MENLATFEKNDSHIATKTSANAEIVTNIRMCMQLVRQCLKFSIECFVKPLFKKLVGQFCIFILVSYKHVSILIRVISGTLDIHPLCVARHVCISPR